MSAAGNAHIGQRADSTWVNVPINGSGMSQRLDKWLWHARMVRTRRDAAALANAGFVRLNGKRTTAPGHPVRIGDVVTIALDRSIRVVQVEGVRERRGGAAEARLLYRDLKTSPGSHA